MSNTMTIQPSAALAVPTALELQDNTVTEQMRAQALAQSQSINLSDTQSILGFGVEQQKRVTEISEQMLDGVRSKDTGPVGAALVNLVTKIRGLDLDDIKPGTKQGFFGKLLRQATPLAKFLQGYETVSSQIDAIEIDLNRHRQQLLRDVVMLDKLYTSTLEYFRSLDVSILAAQIALDHANNVSIPELAAKAESSQDMLDAQTLRDVSQARDTLERKLHDLKLTRQVTLQSLPSIRLVQENDKGLVEKIQSQILNTLPMWKNQMAVAVVQWRAQEAAGAVKQVSDLQNELLLSNAKTLKTSTLSVRNEMERGIYDIESIKQSNQLLIETINESIAIAQEGRTRRAQAEQELIQCENQLKTTLRNAAQQQAKAIAR